MSRSISFIPVEIDLTSKGATMRGWCGSEVIHVGDVFDTVYREALHGEPPQRIESGKQAHLTVKAIRAYRRSINWLDIGMSAEIDFFGKGAEQLVRGEIMGGTSTKEPREGPLFTDETGLT